MYNPGAVYLQELLSEILMNPPTINIIKFL